MRTHKSLYFIFVHEEEILRIIKKWLFNVNVFGI